jgi:hypothetical protein
MSSTAVIGGLVTNTYPPTVGTNHQVQFDGSDYVLVPVGAASVSPKTVTLNLGTAGLFEYSQTFTDPMCTPTSNILVSLSGITPPGSDADESTMDSFELIAYPGAGQVTIYIRGLEGQISGNYNVTYLGY